MSGVEEGAAVADLLAEAAAAYGTEAEGASAALSAYGGGAGASSGALSAADLAALYGAGGGAEGAGALTSADTGAMSGLLGSGAAPGETTGLLGSSGYGSGSTVTDSLTAQPGQGPGLYDELKYKSINALNKAGGQFNKLPGPVQGMLSSSVMKQMFPSGSPPPPAQMPHAQPSMAMPSQPAYSQAPYQAQNFASSYGPREGGQQISPQLLALLKKLQLQGMA